MKPSLIAMCFFVLGLSIQSTAFAETANSLPPTYFVQKCVGADDGQGMASQLLINLKKQNKWSCSVAVYFGFEYGNSLKLQGKESWQSAYEILPQSTKGLKCKVISNELNQLTVTVTNKDGDLLVNACQAGAVSPLID